MKNDPEMMDCANCGELYPVDSYSDDECNRCLGIQGGSQ